MASILPIGDKWRAQVRRAGSKSIAKTFDTRKEAEQWARQIETELDHQRVAVSATMNLASMIHQYRRVREELGRPIDPGSNTNYMLQHLEDDLGHERVEDLTPKRMAQWARARKEQGAGGYTINMELSQLGTVLRHTSSFLQITVPDIVGAARPLLAYGQLITGGARRSRRPTQDELESLLAWLQQRNPIVADAVRVAAVTGLRRSELARIAWADLDERQRAVLVRQRKHPRAGDGEGRVGPAAGRSMGRGEASAAAQG